MGCSVEWIATPVFCVWQENSPQTPANGGKEKTIPALKDHKSEYVSLSRFQLTNQDVTLESSIHNFNTTRLLLISNYRTVGIECSFFS